MNVSCSGSVSITYSGIVVFANVWSGAPATVNATTVAANLTTPVTMSRGSGISASSSTSRFSSTGFNSPATVTMSDNDYYSFTITPSSSYLLNLNGGVVSITLGASGTGPQTYGLYSSIGGFVNSSQQIGANMTNSTNNITLPSSGYNGLTSIEFRIYGWNASAGGGTGGPSGITVNGAVVPGSTINTSVGSLSGFTYSFGTGPSASQTYNISGTGLTPAAGNLTITGSTNYEISTNNSTFSGSVTYAYTGGALTATPVYIRLKSGLSTGN